MSTTRNSAYVISAQVSLLFSGALINFGLGRLLGPSAYGQFGVVYAVATILNLLLTPGIMQSVSKFCASRRQSAESIAGSVLRQQLIVSMVVAVAYYFIAGSIAVLLRDASLASFMRILAPLVIIYSLTAVYGGYLTGIGRFGLQAGQLITYSASRLILTFAFAYFFSLAGAIAALPLAAFAALAYFVIVSKLSFSSARTLGVYKFALPITAFVALISVFQSVDLFIVKALLQDNALAGYYTAAGSVARIPYFVLTALGMVMLPAVAGRIASGQHAGAFVRDAFRYVLIILLPATAVIAATARPLVMLLYRSEYVAAAYPLAILSVGMAALTLAYLFAVIINAAGRPVISASTAVGMVALSVAINITLIPKYGLAGAAAATTFASFASAAILFLVVHSKVGSPFSFLSLARISAASAVVLAIALRINLQNKFLLPLLYAFLGAVYLLALFILRELRKDDFRRLLSLVPKRVNGITQ